MKYSNENYRSKTGNLSAAIVPLLQDMENRRQHPPQKPKQFTLH